MTAVFSGEPRAPPAQISITLPLGRRSPANGGAEAIAAPGGDGDQLSICQEEISVDGKKYVGA